MYIKLLRGSSNVLDRERLERGILVFDRSKKALRIYDGKTKGGYEIPLVRTSPPPNVDIGPSELVGGDYDAGFYGEVTGSEFITANELISEVGLSAGTSINSNAPWLKFVYKQRILFIAKKPYKHSVNWDQLNNANLVYGNTVIDINGLPFKVRLIQGAGYDPIETNDAKTDVLRDLDCEWNALMYHVVSNNPLSKGWATYTDADVNVGLTALVGANTLCQETVKPTDCLVRGVIANGDDVPIQYATRYPKNSKGNFGWRPVLEPIISV